jgi:putative proteasome-type protease
MEAAKCVLVSFDSTMRSNISVGLPIDLVIYDNNSLTIRVQRRIDEADAYFSMIHSQWGEGLRRVFAQLPNPDWNGDGIPDSG